MLKPLIDPLLSSTGLEFLDEQEPEPALPNVVKCPQNRRETTGFDDTLYMYGGEVSIGGNSSVSSIVFQAPKSNMCKLQLFSGTVPVPKGEVDYISWSSAVNLICKRKDVTEDDKCEKFQNSLVVPALSLVQSALDVGSTKRVMSLLQKAYDNDEDVHDLEVKYSTSVQKSTEIYSEIFT